MDCAEKARQLHLILETLEMAARGEEARTLDFEPVDDEIKTLSRATTLILNRVRSLENQARRCAMVMDIMDQGYIEHSLSGRVLYANDAACRMLRRTREELEGSFYSDYHHEDTARALYEKYRAVYHGDRAGEPFEVDLVQKGGATVHRRMKIDLARTSEGKPAFFRTIFDDTTESIQARLATEASERKLALIAANTRDIIWTMNFDFQLTYLSPSVTRLTGFTVEEIMNLPIKYMVPGEIFKTMRDTLTRELEREVIGVIPAEDRIRTLEMPLLKSDGSVFWAEISLEFNRDEDGTPFEIIGVTRDITERRKMMDKLQESEQRFRMIVENMREVIWTTDLDLQYTYVSPSCRILTGYTPEEIMAIPVEEILTPESFIEASTALREELDHEFSGGKVDPYRSRTILQEIRCNHGVTIWMEVTATFIRDNEGRATGMLMAGRDITERKRAEEEKEKLEEQLIQVQKMETIGRLAGGIAHDFNNMLNVILGYVDLARIRLASQHPVLKDIQEIERAAVRSRDITTQLLAFSRKQVVEPKVVNLNELITSSTKTLVHLIGEHVELAFQPGEDLGLVKIDPSQFEQVLINLAVNARDALPEGGTIIIGTDNVELDEAYTREHLDLVPGSYIRLSVIDNGSGMDKETVKHIFEPFYTRKELGQGTGLGLATVYGITKQNGGFITVYSEPGKGTSFHLYLPRTEEALEPTSLSMEPAQRGSGTILLVEDDEMVLDVGRNMLEELGYLVIVARTPTEALKLYETKQAPIDLVITDVIMPVMSGKELRDQLLQRDSAIRVLFMSGYTADVIARQGIIEEGVLFLQKPFTMRELARKVNLALVDSSDE